RELMRRAGAPRAVSPASGSRLARDEAAFAVRGRRGRLGRHLDGVPGADLVTELAADALDRVDAAEAEDAGGLGDDVGVGLGRRLVDRVDRADLHARLAAGAARLDDDRLRLLRDLHLGRDLAELVGDAGDGADVRADRAVDAELGLDHEELLALPVDRAGRAVLRAER